MRAAINSNIYIRYFHVCFAIVCCAFVCLCCVSLRVLCFVVFLIVWCDCMFLVLLCIPVLSHCFWSTWTVRFEFVVQGHVYSRIGLTLYSLGVSFQYYYDFYYTCMRCSHVCYLPCGQQYAHERCFMCCQSSQYYVLVIRLQGHVVVHIPHFIESFLAMLNGCVIYICYFSVPDMCTTISKLLALSVFEVVVPLVLVVFPPSNLHHISFSAHA